MVKKRSRYELTKKIVVYLCAVILMVTIFFPLVWTLITSLQPEIEIYTMPPFPFRMVEFTFGNYQFMFNYQPFVKALLNSGLVAAATAGFVMTAGALGAYTLSRLRFPGRTIIFNAVMIIYMLPGLGLLIPMIITLRIFGLIDSFLGALFAHSIFILPLMTWFLVGIFEAVPPDLEDAAQVDGQTRLGSLIHVILPLSMSGFALVAVFAFIMSWDELMFSSVVGLRNFPLLQPVILSLMEPMRAVIPQMAASGLISALPVIALAVVLQKYIIAGIMRGAIK